MQHWWQLATRSWRTKIGRTMLQVLSIAFGVAVVVWITCSYESVRRAVTGVVLQWIGRSHIIVESSIGVWGTFDQGVEDLAGRIPGVQTTTVRTREYVFVAPPRATNEQAGSPSESQPADRDYIRIEATGVIPEKETHFRSYKLIAGRFLKPSDQNAIVVERLLARQFHLSVGDSIYMRHHNPSPRTREFTIVGIVDRRRASVNQAMMTWVKLRDVQTLCKLPQQIKAVDIIVAHPNVKNIQHIAAELRQRIEHRRIEMSKTGHEPADVQVKTTEAQHKKLGAAQGLLQFIMMLLTCAVLFTAFFIVLATISMGVTERITELGLLRCVGVTRRQLAFLVLLQTWPLGLVGTLLGLPLGLFLQWLTIQAVPNYLGHFAYNTWGIGLAVFGGLGTSLLGAALPAAGALGVSPVQVTRSAGDPRSRRWAWAAALLGILLLGAHLLVNRWLAGQDTPTFNVQALSSIVLLYLGGALLAPIVVMALGRAAMAITARLLGLRSQLVGSEIAKAPFRSASICGGLMVGLSLIVGLVIWGRSVKEGWQFPKEFPDAMLYTYQGVPLDRMLALRDTPGVAEFTVADDFTFSLKPPSRNPLLRRLSLFDQFSRFFAIDPDEGFSIVKMTFLDGNRRDALDKLKKGKHLLITREFARTHHKKLGDRFNIWVGHKRATFTVAGIIASPGLDIAISFFNASTYFQTYSVNAIIGTLADAQRLFGRHYGKLVLFNFNFQQTDTSRIYSGTTPVDVSQKISERTGRPTFAMGPGPIPGHGPEEQIVNTMLKKIGYPPKAFVTARELKQKIDNSIDRVTLLLSVIPLVALLIAALGLGNLMAANVASRSREIAVLRAIGATKNQILRMVIAEALVLALLGSGMGLVLGVALGRTSNFMTERLSGFKPDFTIPWSLVLAGAALATILGILSAVIPARYASRSNIVAVLSDL